MAVGHTFHGHIIVDEDEGTIYLPPELKPFLERKYSVLCFSEGWFKPEHCKGRECECGHCILANTE